MTDQTVRDGFGPDACDQDRVDGPTRDLLQRLYGSVELLADRSTGTADCQYVDIKALETIVGDLRAERARLHELIGELREKASDAIGPGLLQDIGDVLGETPDWRCECGDMNRHHEAFCYRCGAGQPEDENTALQSDENGASI